MLSMEGPTQARCGREGRRQVGYGTSEPGVAKDEMKVGKSGMEYFREEVGVSF